MKLYGLYKHQNLDDLQYNHKKFCEYNNISYNKYYIRGYHDKYHLIYHLLEKNPGETILFVDSNSYFKHLKYEFEFTEDIAIQKSGESVFTNFIVVRSTAESISVFKALLLEASRSVVVERSMDFSPKIPEKYILGELFQQNGVYLNVNICQHANFNSASIMVCYVKPDNWGFFSYANAICNYKPSIYKTTEAKFDVINPGMKNALVSLYTEEIKEVGVISEKSISEYCLKNDITYYIHRELHSDFGQMAGNWAKSRLLLQYIKQHEYIGWIDSDIIISKDYEMLFEDEVHVYNDPCAWEFNSGFMVFKNTPKNELLLQSVTERTANLDRKDSVYVNGGDQTHFIDQVKAHYPELLPKSNMLTNSHIDFQLIDTNKKMIHFMGLPIHIRRMMMDVYYQKFQDQE
jgi:hypothetical protein